MTFGEQVKFWRDLHNYSQREAAEILDVSCAAICRWEKGGREPRKLYRRHVLRTIYAHLILTQQMLEVRIHNLRTEIERELNGEEA